MIEADLKPCPFCGGEAKLFFLEKEHPFIYRVGCIGECKTPYGHSYSYSEKQSAINAWNRRVEQTGRKAVFVDDALKIVSDTDNNLNTIDCKISIYERMLDLPTITIGDKDNE